MAEFNVRSDSINVEQIMEQIRARIREKRGVDYTEQQIRELATVKLQTFLDPGGVRSDLLDQFRRARPAYQPPELPNYAFEDQTLYDSHRAPLRWIRRLLQPILKLFFNPNPLIQALHIQSQLNRMAAEREARREASRREYDQLQYEVLHNLVIETTRMGIEVKNMTMRVESVASRLDFNERRARALEGVVVYKPSIEVEADHTAPPAPSPAPGAPSPPMAGGQEGPGQRSRRRRRRRGRRGGAPAADVMRAGAQGPVQAEPSSHSSDPNSADRAPGQSAEVIEQAMASDLQPTEPFEPDGGPDGEQ